MYNLVMRVGLLVGGFGGTGGVGRVKAEEMS